MNFDTDLLAAILKDDKTIARKVLKAISLVIALETARGKEVSIEYLGTLSKKGRYWSFKESDYFSTIRHQKMSPLEFLDCLLTEDDQNRNDVQDGNRESEQS